MKRSTWILIALLIGLLIAAWAVLQKPGETSSSGLTGHFIAEFDSSSADRLEFVREGSKVIIEKSGQDWMITEPLNYRADAAAVTAAINRSLRTPLVNVVSTNPEKQSVFQVDSSGTRVTLFERGKPAADFIVGKPGTSYNETYLRRANSDDVYLAEGVLGPVFSRTVKDWRSKEIFASDQESITAVQFSYGDTTFGVTFTDSTWRVGSDPANQVAVNSLLGSLSNLQADDFVDDGPNPLPRLVAIVEVKGTQIRFYHAAEGDKYLVQTSASPQWFSIQPWRAAQILKRKKDLVQA